MGIFSDFQQFWGKFLSHSPQSLTLSPHFCLKNGGRQILLFGKTQKTVQVLKYDENYQRRKLPKIAKFEVNLGYRSKFWTN